MPNLSSSEVPDLNRNIGKQEFHKAVQKNTNEDENHKAIIFFISRSCLICLNYSCLTGSQNNKGENAFSVKQEITQKSNVKHGLKKTRTKHDPKPVEHRQGNIQEARIKNRIKIETKIQPYTKNLLQQIIGE